jgi:hypothetical protein
MAGFKPTATTTPTYSAITRGHKKGRYGHNHAQTDDSGFSTQLTKGKSLGFIDQSKVIGVLTMTATETTRAAQTKNERLLSQPSPTATRRTKHKTASRSPLSRSGLMEAKPSRPRPIVFLSRWLSLATSPPLKLYRCQAAKSITTRVL